MDIGVACDERRHGTLQNIWKSELQDRALRKQAQSSYRLGGWPCVIHEPDIYAANKFLCLGTGKSLAVESLGSPLTASTVHALTLAVHFRS